MIRFALLFTALVGFGTLAADGPKKAGPKLEYNRDVRPILAEHCFQCHGPDSAARKANLRLDQRDAAIKVGAISPNQPDESELIRRIFAEDETERMPPEKIHKPLKPEQKEVLKRWIAAGAEYQPHWSLIAPQRPELPVLRDPKPETRNPIDYFIAAELQKRGLTMAPEADRRTLARRLSLDLTGLPPDPERVEKFVNDSSPDAYEKLVDDWLQSPDWGEHRARYWLDAARYADTHGIHIDNFREIWSYREWVIKAFNRNLPFDQFTIEQLAGDLLPNRTLETQIASGFNRCNITTNEGGAIDEEYLVLYTRDRTETTSQVFMGLTAGCAVCHDHKFDPISQREFYSLSAFFNNTTQKAMDGNVSNTPPIVPVPKAEDQPRFEQLPGLITAAKDRVNARRDAARPDYDWWLADQPAICPYGQTPTADLMFHAPLDEGEGKAIHVSVNGLVRSEKFGTGYAWTPAKESRKGLIVRPGASIELADVGDFEKDKPFAVTFWARNNRPGQTGAILARMDIGEAYRGWDAWMENGRMAMHIIHHWPDDALKVSCQSPLPVNQWAHVTITYDGSGNAGGVHIFVDGEAQALNVDVDALANTIRTDVPLTLGQRNTSQRVQNVALHDIRIYGRVLPTNEIVELAKFSRAGEILRKPATERSKEDLDELFGWWIGAHDAEYRQLEKQTEALVREDAEIKARGTIAHVMQEKPAAPMAYVLFRGDYDKRRDAVTPAVPAALPPFPADLPKNRLGLAQWLLRSDHPLMARVTVNRFWQELFGMGLVRTAGDFGVTGDLPSHPELLDWLAVEFRESGWDVKKLFKLMVMSAAYRQSAATTSEKRDKDPQNRALSRGPRFRMDAEMVRDNALASSGLLVRKIGGPSVRPYQPEGVWEAVAMRESDTRNYKRDSGENLYRRSLYTFWKRSAPPAAMETFNAPTRESCTVRRERTNTPLQALVTLNDTQFVEAARHLAQTTLQSNPESPEAGINRFAVRLLSRPFRPEEMSVVRASLDKLLLHYQANLEEAKKLIAVGESKADEKLDPATLAAWTMLANELMNLDEVLNK
jgi:hypothetical protein